MNTKQAPLRIDLNKVVDPHTTAWQIDDYGDVVTLLANGWAVVDLYKDSTGKWWSTKPKQSIPSHIMAKLPDYAVAAMCVCLGKCYACNGSGLKDPRHSDVWCQTCNGDGKVFDGRKLVIR